MIDTCVSLQVANADLLTSEKLPQLLVKNGERLAHTW